MSSQLKFRAWDGQKFVEVHKLEYVSKEKSFNGVEGYTINDHLGIPSDYLHQFTGLLDQNGIKIYEGDYLKHSSEREAKQVELEFGCFYFGSQPLNQFILSQESAGLELPYLENLEVVGNIFEHKTDVPHAVGIPAHTVQRLNLFKPDESERLLLVASAFHKSIEVLGSLDKARRWFTSPKMDLGGKTPLELCDTDIGTKEVCNLLGRIEHGIFT